MATPDILEAWRRHGPLMEDMTMKWSVNGDTAASLTDLGERRLHAMDEAGIDVAVLSLTTPGLQGFAAPEAVALQGPSNDVIADAIRRHPDRFQGFATLATPDPAAAVRELERTITQLGFNGVMLHARSGDHFVDEPQYWGIFEAAEYHRIPIYLHPGITLNTVSAAYYSGFGHLTDGLLRSGAPGWHYQTGMVLLRLILSGLFDRFPDLQIILGHWGEMVLFYLDRIAVLDRGSKLARPIAEYFRTNVLITSSGIASQRYLRWSMEVVGPDRILHATDYPYNSAAGDHFARTFLTEAPISGADRDSIGFRNWERIVDKIRR
jgi:uncharacterized protein